MSLPPTSRVHHASLPSMPASSAATAGPLTAGGNSLGSGLPASLGGGTSRLQLSGIL